MLASLLLILLRQVEECPIAGLGQEPVEALEDAGAEIRTRSPSEGGRFGLLPRLSEAAEAPQAPKTTRYFDEQVTRKRPYVDADLCRAVLASPLRRERQEDGRIRFWGRISLSGKAADRILRVITLEDGETIHNAFLDRSYREDEQ